MPAADLSEASLSFFALSLSLCSGLDGTPDRSPQGAFVPLAGLWDTIGWERHRTLHLGTERGVQWV